MYTYTYVCMYVYIYIYIERERDLHNVYINYDLYMFTHGCRQGR